MIKADIIKRVAADLDLRDMEALAVVDAILDSMREIITNEGRLEIRDFGVFQVKDRKPRLGRNPKDKRTYPIPPRRVVTFKIGKELRDSAVNADQPASGDASSPSESQPGGSSISD